MAFSPIPVDPWSFFPEVVAEPPPLALPPARCVFEAVTRFEAHRRRPYAVPRNIQRAGTRNDRGELPGCRSRAHPRVRPVVRSTRISNDETHFRHIGAGSAHLASITEPGREHEIDPGDGRAFIMTMEGLATPRDFMAARRILVPNAAPS